MFSNAQFEVWFNLATPFDYVFHGTFSAGSIEKSVDPTSWHTAAWRFSLSGSEDGTSPVQRFSGFGVGADSSTVTGTLAPGVYYFFVDAFAEAATQLNRGSQGVGHAGFDFTLDLSPSGSAGTPSPVPEPTSLLLLGTGVLAIVRRLRRPITAAGLGEH